MARSENSTNFPEARLAQIYLDIAEVIILVINNAGIVTEINRKGTELLGYPKNEIIGKSWFDNYIPERMRNEVKTNFDKMLSGAITLEHFENPVLTRSGEEKIIAWHNSYLRDQKGSVIGTVSSGEDVTERKRLETELDNYRQRLEEGVADRTSDYARTNQELKLTTAELGRVEAGLQLRTLMMDKASVAIFLIDKAGKLLYANEAANQYFEFERERLIGMSFWQIVQPQTKQVVESALEELAKKGRLDYETEYTRKDGTIMPVLVHSSLITTSNGEYIVSIVDDITRLKMKTEHS